MSVERPPLWACPTCGRTFANRNQTHTCATLTDLAGHFAGKQPSVRATFDRIVEVVSALGPVSVLPEKTRVALHVRMSFAAFTPRLRWLDGHLVLAPPRRQPAVSPHRDVLAAQHPARVPADRAGRGG